MSRDDRNESRTIIACAVRYNEVINGIGTEAAAFDGGPPERGGDIGPERPASDGEDLNLNHPVIPRRWMQNDAQQTVAMGLTGWLMERAA